MLQTILETGGVPRFITRDIAAQVLREARADVGGFFRDRRGEITIDIREVFEYLEGGPGYGDA